MNNRLRWIERRRGFSLVELLIVVGMLLVLSVAATPLYGNLQGSSQINEATTQTVAVIRKARERAISGWGDASYGVKFEINGGSGDRMILYRGDSYVTRVPEYDEVWDLGKSLSLATTWVGNEVQFTTRDGKPAMAGQVTLLSSVKGSRMVSVNEWGVVEEN